MVGAVVLGAVSLLLASAPAHGAVDWFGVNNGQAIRTDLVSPAVFHDRLSGMGGNVLREDVGWETVEPSDDAWYWGYLDEEINSAPAGTKVILMFFNSPKWARDQADDLLWCALRSAVSCRMPPSESKLDEWQELVRETLTRYRDRVIAVEVWNEPNLKSFWRPGGDEPERWARLVRATAQVVDELGLAIPVLTGGLGIGTGSESNVGMEQGAYLDAAYASMPELASLVDGIGIHPYGGQRSPSDPTSWSSRTLAAIRPVRDARDPGTPLWATEVGYYTDEGPYPATHEQQRDWLLEQYDIFAAAPDLRAMVIHSLFNNTWSDSEIDRNWGLVTGDNVPKLAWTAFRDRLVSP